MIPLDARVVSLEDGWYGKTIEYVGESDVRIQVESPAKDVIVVPLLSVRETSVEENNLRLHLDMVETFLNAAKRRLVANLMNGDVEPIHDGTPFTYTYTAPFNPEIIAELAKRRGITLPKVLVVT